MNVIGATPTPELEQHRVELTRYCRRMLGSGFEADDAVQETMVRAWQALGRFEGRASLRSWLYRIATNVCIDMLRHNRRRGRSTGLASTTAAEASYGAALPAQAEMDANSDRLVQPAGGAPAELTASRETIRLAFVAALRHLSPRQRAVVFLREVLRRKADEVAELLGSTVPSVNSALQRARATLVATDVATLGRSEPMDEPQRLLLARYVDAFERYDIESLISVVREDVKPTSVAA